jgi:hypothetical protein
VHVRGGLGSNSNGFAVLAGIDASRHVVEHDLEGRDAKFLGLFLNDLNRFRSLEGLFIF